METTSKFDFKLILFCGGKGTRMWPISKVGHPKQFGPILGEKSFFRQSVERTLAGFPAKDIFVSTGEDFKKVIQEQAPEIHEENTILEPIMRDTLGAVALAAAKINHQFPNSVMAIIWGADHIVKDEQKLIKALKKAAQLAYENDIIVHIDMKPTYPSVHNGWIRIGKKLRTEEGFDIYEFIKQVEKPDLETAKKFFKEGSYLIHSGYMVTKPKLLLEKYKKYSPECYKTIEKISKAFGSREEKTVLIKEYPKIEKNSIDFGILEKLQPGTQWEIPVEIGWVDLGTWELIYNGLPKDENGNVTLGKVELIDVKDSLIFSRDNKIIGVIGFSKTIIIDTPEGLLVCSMDKAPLVKELYKNLFEKS